MATVPASVRGWIAICLTGLSAVVDSTAIWLCDLRSYDFESHELLVSPELVHCELVNYEPGAASVLMISESNPLLAI